MAAPKKESRAGAAGSVVCMFRRRATPPPPAGWDPVVTVTDGEFVLASDTVEVYLHAEGASTVWRGPDDYCHTRDPATTCQILEAAHNQRVPVRATGEPPPTDTRGIVRG